jgi:DNA-binding response OmpR family regulator
VVLAESSQSGPAETPSTPSATKELRLLLVEDDEAVAAGLRWSLEEQGVTVQVSTTGAEVLPALAAFRPDAVVLDLSLPDEDGRSVFQRKADVFDGPVIFSSGHALEHEIETLLENPRAAFLMKPYTPQELLRIINELLDIDRKLR